MILPPNSINKTLLLFDVDGTIANYGENVTPNIIFLLQNIDKTKYELGIVSGGKIERILQSIHPIANQIRHFFFECGCVYYQNVSYFYFELLLHNVYTKNIRSHPLFPKINQLIDIAYQFLSAHNTAHINIRNAIVAISFIGETTNKKEIDSFIEIDKTCQHVHQLKTVLYEKAVELTIENNIILCENPLGISIYPREYDKIQVLEHLIDKYKEIHYFGDQHNKEPQGNDYLIINDQRIIGHKIDSVEHTETILREFI